MKITSISGQVRDKNRVNVFVDGVYRLSLDAYQLIELGIKVGSEFGESELTELETDSIFGKAYGRALAYCLMRLHSGYEVKTYLFRKTRPTLDKNGQKKAGLSEEVIDRVYSRLESKGYIDDVRFASKWVDNRSMIKGVSRRKLRQELKIKGVADSIINKALELTERSDGEELKKVILKKRSKYPDNQKFTTYLARLGFNYEDIKNALSQQL